MAHILGVTYISCDNVFGVDEYGHLEGQSPAIGATSTPVTVGRVADGNHRVYVLTDTSGVYGFTNSLAAPAFIFNVPGATMWSLAHAGNLLFVGTGTYDTPNNGGLVALGDEDGQIRWFQDFATPVLYPPTVLFQGSVPTRVIVGTQTNLHAFDPVTGQEIWTQPGTAYDQIVHGQTLLHADLQTTGLVARSAIDGSLVWQHPSPTNSNYFRPAAWDDVLYASAEDATVTALNVHTGAELWRAKTPPYPGVPVPHIDKNLGRGVVALAAGENSLGDSHLMALDASNGSQLWTLNLSAGGPGQSPTDPIMGVWGAVQVGTPDGRLMSVNVLTGELIWQRSLTSNAFVSRPRWNWF